MSKLLKYIIGLIVTILILVGIGIFLATRYINPEMLQEKIITGVHDATGRDLTINGGLQWTLFPRVSVEVKQATLSNPASFSDKAPLATIGSLEFTVSLLPLLLERHIVLDEIIINDATITLTTLSNGQTNWKDLTKKPAEKNNKKETSNTNDNAVNKPVTFNIAELMINNSILNWNDQQTGKQWQVSELTVTSSDLALNHASPLTINGKYNAPAAAVITWEMDSKISIDPSKQLYLLKPVKITATVEGEKPFTLSLSELQLNDLDQIIILKDAVFSGANINGKGGLEIHSFKQQPQAQGHFSFDQLTFDKLKTSNVNVPISSSKGVYVADSITSKLYGGTFTGKTTLNNSGNIPQWQLNYQLANIDLQSLITDIDGGSKFSGVMQSNGQLSAAGLKGDVIKSSLSGPAHFKIDNGVYTGVDLTYWWHIGNDLLKGATTAAIPTIGTITDITTLVDMTKYKNTNQTAFSDISADFTFKDGVGTTNNFILFNDTIYVKAQGQIDFVNQKVNLKLFISQSANGAAQGPEIPFILQGDFNHITVKPDLASFPALAGSAASAVTKGVTSLSNKVPAHLQEPVQKLAEPLGNAIGNFLNKK